jgi:hypothetical protein
MMTADDFARHIELGISHCAEQRRLRDLERDKRVLRMIAESEAARIARGEPRQPPYVYPPEWAAYKARAAFLIAESEKGKSKAVARAVS